MGLNASPAAAWLTFSTAARWACKGSIGIDTFGTVSEEGDGLLETGQEINSAQRCFKTFERCREQFLDTCLEFCRLR